MTIAAAVADGTSIIAGADSAASGGVEIYTCSEEKIFTLGPYLFGYCGSYRIGQILRYRMELPDPPDDADSMTSFLVRDFIPLLRSILQSEGASSEGLAFLGPKTALIVGCHGRLWCINPDLMVAQTMPYVAIGSGRLQAYGAFHALESAGVEPPQRRLELALNAAAEFTANVRRPFRFITLNTDPQQATNGELPPTRPLDAASSKS